MRGAKRRGKPLDCFATLAMTEDNMKTAQLLNYAQDQWIPGEGNLAELTSAIDGAPVATTGSGGVDFGGMLSHAREVGGPLDEKEKSVPAPTAGSTSRAARARSSPSHPRAAANCPTPMS